MEHITPCPSLEKVGEDLKEHRSLLFKHERELGGLGNNMSLMLEGQKKLFLCIDDLAKVATRNETNIRTIQTKQDALSETIGNGLKEEIAKTVVAHAKGEDGLALEKRFQEIEKVLWLPKILDNKFKKLIAVGAFLAIVMGIVIFSAFITVKMWGHIKSVEWGETPGLMQSLAVDKNSHIHTDTTGGTYIHSHENPDGPLVKSQIRK